MPWRDCLRARCAMLPLSQRNSGLEASAERTLGGVLSARALRTYPAGGLLLCIEVLVGSREEDAR